MSRNLVVHYKRVTYLIEPSRETRRLAGKRVRIHEWSDGRIEIHCGERRLPYSIFDKNPCVTQGDIVGNKRLSDVLSLIQYAQKKRHDLRLASKKLTFREKERIFEKGHDARDAAKNANPAGDAFAIYLEQVQQEQKAKQRADNQLARKRRREREMAGATISPG